MSQDEARHKSSKEKAEVPVVSLSFDISHQKITQSQVRDKGKRILKFDTT